MPQYEKNILIKLYLLSIELVENRTDEIYYELERLVKKNRDNIPTNFLKPFYTNLSNYCVKMLRKGRLQFYESLLKVYKEMHYNNVFISYNIIRVGLLKNIITVCCYNRKFSLAKNWLDNYINYVDARSKKSVYVFNQGVIEFSKGNFGIAHSLLVQVKKINYTHDIALRIYVLKCLYETEKKYNDSTKQSLESTYLFFSQNKTMVITEKKSYQNFIKILLKLYKLKNYSNNKDRILQIKSKLPNLIKHFNSMKLIQSKHWLLKKIEELRLNK